jgi:hypothetical protein
MTPSLEEVISPAKRVLHVNDKEYYPRRLDAFGMQLIVKAQENPKDVIAMCKVVARGFGVSVAEVFGTEDQIGWAPSDIRRAVGMLTEEILAVEEGAPPNSEPAGTRTEG